MGKVKLDVLFLSCLIGLLFVSQSFAKEDLGEVTQAFFTSKLKNNTPQNQVLILENNNQNLYFYSEIINMQGKTLLHRWEHQGEKVFEQKFSVSANSQGLISKCKLDPVKTGEWMVVITDERGWPIKASMFKYVKKGSFAGKGILPIK